jgi:hypothetical protein
MTVSFTGGLIVGNPWLPNYLVDRIKGRSQGIANANVKAPPAPSTAVEYLNLMNYDEKALTPAERSVAAILNDTVAHLDLRKPPFQIFSEQVLPKIETVQPGEDLTKIRAAVQQCQDNCPFCCPLLPRCLWATNRETKSGRCTRVDRTRNCRNLCQMGTRGWESALAYRSEQSLREHYHLVRCPLRKFF